MKWLSTKKWDENLPHCTSDSKLPGDCKLGNQSHIKPASHVTGLPDGDHSAPFMSLESNVCCGSA